MKLWNLLVRESPPHKHASHFSNMFRTQARKLGYGHVNHIEEWEVPPNMESGIKTACQQYLAGNVSAEDMTNEILIHYEESQS